MATVAELNTAEAACRAAIGDADYATALNYALQCQSILAALPDGSFSGTEQNFRREAVNELVANCRRARGGSLGVQRTRIKHIRPTT